MLNVIKIVFNVLLYIGAISANFCIVLLTQLFPKVIINSLVANEIIRPDRMGLAQFFVWGGVLFVMMFVSIKIYDIFKTIRFK